MASIKLLYDLQLADTDLDRVVDGLARVRRGLGDESLLEGLRHAVQEARERLQRLRAQHKDAEMTSRELRDKAQALEQKLYGGSVRNPRELTSMQEELAYLRKHLQEAEEALLNVMIALEDHHAVADQEEGRLSQAEATWNMDQQRLREELAALESDLARLQASRQALVARIVPGDMQAYEQIRKTHGGLAVAKVQRGMCEACRITLSSKELQQVQMSAGLVRCNSCGRLLLAG